MAWTAPSTFVAGTILTAAQMNTNVRDNTLAGGPIYATTAARDAAIPTPFAGQRAFVTATNVNYQYNGTAWVSLQTLSAPPMATVPNANGVTVTNNVDTVVAFQAAVINSTGSGITVTTGTTSTTYANGGKITVSTTGVYLVSYVVTYDSNATGVRSATIATNGTGSPSSATGTGWTQMAGAAQSASLGTTVLMSLTAADFIQLAVRQTSGGNLNVNPNGGFVHIMFVGKTA